MTSGASITIPRLRSYLQQCGYRHSLLQENYLYEDSLGSHQVPLVGFAHQAYDVRNACVAGVNGDSLGELAVQHLVDSYRGLGAPVFFLCCKKELQWWGFTVEGPEFRAKVAANHVPNFFDARRKKLSPESIYRAKTLGRLDSQYQLDFVDVGLMPLLEREMGEKLVDLMDRMIEALYNERERPPLDVETEQWLFQSAFWLLGARILRDKQVPGFRELDLEDIPELMRKVRHHYNADQAPGTATDRQRQALKAAARTLGGFASLKNLTVESLAYVYENALISQKTRRALGTHATPSFLVDYIVWKLARWIEGIPRESRLVLEPMCGHAPFLTSAARLLREFNGDDPAERHEYLKERLLGIEVDTFAREIARLSLTLADVPNPNGWKLTLADAFKRQVLSEAARRSTILLCNPPFQNFSRGEKSQYASQGVQLSYGNKAAEILARTLPHMATGSVFGVILPQGFLHHRNLADLRKMIIEQFELAEICELPENTFSSARHKSVVILGRKLDPTQELTPSQSKTRVLHIQRWDLKKFIDSYQASPEELPQWTFNVAPSYDLHLRVRHEVWEYCRQLPSLGMVADVGKGLEYKGRDLPPDVNTVSTRRFPGSVQGYAKFDRGVKLTGKPQLYCMSLEPEVIRRPGWGVQTGVPQVLLNYARVSHGPWRLKALIDLEGRPVTSRFLVVRPRSEHLSLEAIWGMLNSPFANAYAYCHSLERDNLTAMVRSLPLPDCDPHSLLRLHHLVQGYLGLTPSTESVLEPQVDAGEAKRRMLAIDAEVMHLYDLPPRLERQVLDLFAGWERKGVDFEFTRYFPKDYESHLPLHVYLCEDYQRSSAPFVNGWVESVRSPILLDAFEAAVATFKSD